MKKCILFSFLYYLCYFQILITSPSNYDTSFNNNGSSTNLYAANSLNQAQDIIAQPDGKIVTVGSSGENGIIARYLNDGTLDQTFNSTSSTPGFIIIQLGTQTGLYAVTLQPTDGKILVAGYVINSNGYNAFIARYNRNGFIDTTLNGTGYITTIFQTQSQLFGIALQNNGSIIVAGWTIADGATQAVVARYTNSGILDTTFNEVGYVTTLIGDVFTKAQDVALQADGKIVITGQAQVDGNQGLIVIRYNGDGSIDETFHENGYVFPFPDSTGTITSQGNGLAIQFDQKIVIVGYTNADDFSPGNRNYTVLRLNNDGSLDETFHETGYIINVEALQAQGIVIQTNGQIVTCGFNYTSIYIPIVIRYNNDGSVDPSFNFTINQNSANCLGNAVALQIDGKIIITGTIQAPFRQSAQ